MSLIPNPQGDWDTDDWRARAACRDTAPDLFFPVGVTGQAIDQIAAAKAVCGRCPVKAACLEFALVTNQESGVWGGTTEDERRRIRRMWLTRRRQVRVAGALDPPTGSALVAATSTARSGN